MPLFDYDKAIERIKLVISMQSMSKKELAELGDCDRNCPSWDGCSTACNSCHATKGCNTLEELEVMSEKNLALLQRPQGALGANGCEMVRKKRSWICLRTLCNPYQKVAGVKNG